MKLRIWGLPVVRLLHLPTPDDLPARIDEAAAEAAMEEHIALGSVEPESERETPDGGARLAPEDVEALRDRLSRMRSDTRPVVTERLDVPPERRPWDIARPTIPPTGDGAVPAAEVKCPQCRDAIRRKGEARRLHLPHCNGRHGIEEDEAGSRCEYCDALSGAITLVRSLEKRVVGLESRVAELCAESDRRAEYDREMKERS